MANLEDENVKETKEKQADGAASSMANEVIHQLGDFVSNRPSQVSDSLAKIMIDHVGNGFALSEKDRTEALKQVGNSLDSMVKGDIPKLIDRLKELGVSTKELEEKQKHLTEKVEAAKPLEEAILKGDAAAMQKVLATMDPKQVNEVAELIQKHFDQTGMGLEVDYTDGKLIVSKTNGDRAVAVSADKVQLIGVNQDGSYDFNRQFRHGNAGNELKAMGDNALSNYMYPPRKAFYNEDRYQLQQLEIGSTLKDVSNSIGQSISNKIRHK